MVLWTNTSNPVHAAEAAFEGEKVFSDLPVILIHRFTLQTCRRLLQSALELREKNEMFLLSIGLQLLLFFVSSGHRSACWCRS